MTVLAILGVFSIFRQYCCMQYGYLSVFYLEHLGEISGVHPDTITSISISVLTSDIVLSQQQYHSPYVFQGIPKLIRVQQ